MSFCPAYMTNSFVALYVLTGGLYSLPTCAVVVILPTQLVQERRALLCGAVVVTLPLQTTI